MRMYFGLETQGRGVDANGFPPRLRVNENRSFPGARFGTAVVGLLPPEVVARSITSCWPTNQELAVRRVRTKGSPCDVGRYFTFV